MQHNIVIFGDSITQGAYDSERGGWVSQFAADCYGQEGPVLVFNLGISGGTSASLRARYDAELSARVEWAEKVTVMFATGGNDALVTLATGEHWVALETYIENMRYFIRDVKSRGYQPVCIGLSTSDESKLNPIPWDTDTALRMADVSLYDESLKTLAESEGALYIPMRDVFENQLDLLVDGDHPGSEGHRRMYVRVKEYLEKTSIL